MDGAFDPHAIESELYAQWERSGVFAPSGNGTPYCIMIPPPNVTGRLHMGHAFQQTIMDALIRYRRMRGDRTLWQVGTDHAGISTQMVVQRQLEAAGIARESLTREEFVERVWQWRETTGRDIERQMRRMGSSVDWSRNRFTMDDGFSNAVREVFVQLHERGFIYRGERLVNWDPVLKTGISDLEVENEEEAGHLYHVRYPLASGARTGDGADHLIVATTRPETMLGDTAVAVHPDDERYRSLVGARVLLPLANREIPIIADAYVDREFGTGCVKITPAHDFNDYEIGTRHDLPRINILTPDARINDNAPERFRGLDRERARAAVLAELTAAGLLARVDDHRLPIPRGDRSGAIIEPFLSTQWFVRMAPLAERAVAAVRDGRVQFVPKQYENLYFAWMREIKDWNISRQLWWGHRIPAWHAADGSVYVGRDEAAVRTQHKLADDVVLVQDSDVLETWFSSALWTFGTLGWPQKTPELAHFHPTDVLVTGHDIIFFWVARMIMMTLEFTGEVPFRKVYMHGLVRDAEGQKMSKTKGNGLDPLDLVDGITLDALVAKRTEGLMQPQLAERIERATRREFPDGLASYGADALRFNFCAMASSGRDIRLDLSRIGGYRNFCNKLWNATRYVLANVDRAGLAGPVELGPTERWITSRLQRLIADVDQHFENYRFDLLANALYEFIWHEYCDWYLELAKPLLRDESLSEARRRGTRVTLVEVLETALRVLHPVTPFLTEALWRRVQEAVGDAAPGPEPATLMVQAYPRHDPTRIHADDEASIQWLQGVVMALRNLRGEQNVPPSREIDVLLCDGNTADRTHAEAHARLVCTLARVRTLRWLAADETAPVSATALAGGLRMLVPLAGLIDVDAECKRLDREVERKRGEIERLAAKLANSDFVARAPAAVVERERQKLADGQRALDTLVQQREALAPTQGA